MQMMRLVEVQRAHQVNILPVEFRVLQKLTERVFDKSDTLFGRVDLVRLFLAERDKSVIDISLVLFQPRFHFFHLLRGNHSVAVEHARGFLQVFERGDLSRFLTRDFPFRRDIVIDVFAARHIVKSALRFVRRSFKSARVLRQAVRRVLYIQYDRLIADCRLPPRFFQ